MFRPVSIYPSVISNPIDRLVDEIGYFVKRLGPDSEAPERIGLCLALLKAHGATKKANDLFSQIAAMIENATATD